MTNILVSVLYLLSHISFLDKMHMYSVKFYAQSIINPASVIFFSDLKKTQNDMNNITVNGYTFILGYLYYWYR